MPLLPAIRIPVERNHTHVNDFQRKRSTVEPASIARRAFKRQNEVNRDANAVKSGWGITP